MPQFSVLFYANYTILATQRGGMAPCPPLNTPLPKTKSTSQARIKPEIFVYFRPEPDPKSPARLTTLGYMRCLAVINLWFSIS